MFIAQVLVGPSIKLHKEIIQIENNIIKNPNWQEADQLAIYKRVRRVELGATKNQLQLVVRVGLEPGTTGFQVRRPNHFFANLAPGPSLTSRECTGTRPVGWTRARTITTTREIYLTLDSLLDPLFSR